MQALLVEGADVNAKTEDNGATALIVAAAYGHPDVVQTLFDKGGDINAKASNGTTALIMAAQNSHIDVVKTLLEKKADIHATRNDAATALTVAKDEKIKTLLVQASAKS